MAIYHANIRILTRSQNHSAVAGAAYRCGTSLLDERTGTTHDFSHKKGVLSATMAVPADAPPWARDIAAVWNRAEAAETRLNSRVGRDLVVALPHELPEPERLALAHRIADFLVERYTVAVLVALHAPDPGGDARNFHAHLMMSTRMLGPEGFGAKVRAMDDREQGPLEVVLIREAVALFTNEALRAAGVEAHVDPRSLREQAKEAERDGDLHRAAELTRVPTEPLGRVQTAALRRGERVAKAEDNAERRASHKTWLDRFRAAAKKAGFPALSPSSAKPSRPRLRELARLQFRLSGNVLGGSVRIARATGRDAELLNSQAAMLEEGARVTEENAQRHLDGLRRAAEHNARLVEEFLAAGGCGVPSMMRAQCSIAGGPDLIRRTTEARLALRALKKEMPRRRRAHGAAMIASGEARKKLEALDEQQPSAFNLLTRRQWKEKRRAQKAQVEACERQERRVRRSVQGDGEAALNAEMAALRKTVRLLNLERLATVRRAKVAPEKYVAPPPVIPSSAADAAPRASRRSGARP